MGTTSPLSPLARRIRANCVLAIVAAASDALAGAAALAESVR
jgi:hypothetical protein